MSIAPGSSVTLRVPASSANLGPGFDCIGLALGVWDEATVTVTDEPGLVIDVTGTGADTVPRDASHLVHRTMVSAWRHLGVPVPAGVHLSTHNAVPHGRGLGSSATAIVMGVAAAQALSSGGEIDLDVVNELACALEGHPDNASASVFGGATLSVTEAGSPLPRTRTVPLRLDPRIVPVVLVPHTTLSTHTARSVLPDVVPLATAAANSSRTGVLVHALTSDPSLLTVGTTDLLHQEPRRPSYPESMALVDDLRAADLAATISGAGPSVLTLTTAERTGRIEEIVAARGDVWQVLTPGVPDRGVHAVS
ncbi:MAG TPA: homoserine kinase [Candidatus Olsenella excrementigallinarum]|nr:homoserine kinase [Candidatus Janibacter merdipullorum]HJB48251.1 homoserine kinase [Candidatus Olsenella excrementigallinarum]